MKKETTRQFAIRKTASMMLDKVRCAKDQLTVMEDILEECAKTGHASEEETLYLKLLINNVYRTIYEFKVDDLVEIDYN